MIDYSCFRQIELTKAKIWKNPAIFSYVENLAQNRHFWSLRTCEGWNLAKFRNFQSRWKFGSKLRVWPLGTCEKWNLAKSRNFELPWILCSKLTFLTCKPAKNEIWQNPENLIHVENLAQKWHFSPLKRPAKDEIWQNPDILSHHIENLAKTDIFDNLEHGKDEFWQHPEISSCAGYLAQNWEFWPLWTCKYEIWQNPEIMSCVENLAQILDFQPLRTCVG